MNRKIALIHGASNHSTKKRESNDYYATEPIALKKFLTAIDFEIDHFIWEPACGGGHLVDVLEKNGKYVLATDIINRNNKAILEIDFLKVKSKWRGDIITNPPFKNAEAFVKKGLSLLKKDRYLILFLKIMFLESKQRLLLFKKCPPKYIYIHSSRVAIAKNGDFEKYSKGGKSMCFAWFVWQKGHNADPVIKWIP